MKNNKNFISKVFLIITSVLTFLLGIVFTIQLARIYFRDTNGTQMYTREICAKYLLQILPVIIIWVLIIIAAGIYLTIHSSKDKSSKVSNIVKLNNLLGVANILDNKELENEYAIIKKEEKKRKIVWIINVCIISICGLMCLCYLLNTKHFDAEGDFNGQIINMSYYLLPWCIISAISFIGCVIFEEISALKTLDSVKAIIKANGKKTLELKQNPKENLIINIVRACLGALAVVFIIVGIINGGASDVLLKALVICTECIGLG